MHRSALRLLTYAAVLATLVAAAPGCSLDEAELVDPETSQVTAEPEQLRVLTYADDPGDRWLDAVPADPAVFSEGDEFREDDSRTAAPDEPAERRRLFTAVAPGRTLLVELNCPTCGDEAPRTGSDVLDLHVWDLVVGDPDQAFSAGTAIARSGARHDLAIGGYFVVVRPAAAGSAVPTLVGSDPDALRLVAAHAPDDGADLYVDVFVAVAPGTGTVSYDTGDSTTEFAATVR